MDNNILQHIIRNYDHLKYALLKAQTFDPLHYGFPEIYYQIMETDKTRVGAFQKAFEAYDFKDKVVCEAGIGRLALTKFYLPKVKKAYLIENNPALFEEIKTMIKDNGWSHKVELIFEDALTVELPESVDVIIGEMMSIYCANEFQVQVFQHLRQFLKPKGKLFPEKIINIAQLAYANFDSPHKHYPIFLTHHYPTQYSLQEVINTINLYTDNQQKVNKKITLIPMLSGKVNAILMNSFVQISEGYNFTGTDSLMPPTVCKLEHEVEVIAGKPMELLVDFKYGTSLEDASFVVEPVFEKRL